MFTSKVMMASSAHLNLYTQEQELCLNIYPSNDSPSHQPTENMSRISIQLNRLSSNETHQHSLQHRPHVCPTATLPASSASQSQPTMSGTVFAATSLDENLNQSNRRRKLPNDVTNLDLICSQQGEIKIFIKRKKRHQDNRLKLWRYLHRMSPLKGKQHHHSRHPTAVHFYSPVLCSQKESSEDHNSNTSPTANAYPIGSDTTIVSQQGQEDDLEAYMKEIKLRENQSGPIPWEGIKIKKGGSPKTMQEQKVFPSETVENRLLSCIFPETYRSERNFIRQLGRRSFQIWIQLWQWNFHLPVPAEAAEVGLELEYSLSEMLRAISSWRWNLNDFSSVASLGYYFENINSVTMNWLPTGGS